MYPIGVPSFFGFMLFRYRKRLNEPGVRLQLGFLFSNYNHDSWWWEQIEMAHSEPRVLFACFAQPSVVWQS